MTDDLQKAGGNFPRTADGSKLFSRRSTIFAAVSLAVMIFLAYSNTFDSSWHFDDEPNILERSALHLTSLDTEQVSRTFFLDGRLYRPVACLSLALNYYFGGDSVTGYHVVNTIIHIVAAFFLYLLIRRIGTLPSIGKKWDSKVHAVALLSAALWALNPINTQAVTYIVQRMASMAAMFYVIAMYFYLRGRLASSIKESAGWFSLCAAAGLLAVGAKENAALLPLSLMVMEFVLIKPPETLITKKRLWISAAALAAMVAVVVILRGPSFFDPAWLQESYAMRPFTFWERVLTQPRILVHYLTLVFYPMPDRLSISHDIQVSTGLLSPPETAIAIIGLAALATGAFLSRTRFPIFSFAVMFFFVNHLVESTILPLELIFEHRNYLPSMFLFVPVMGAVYGSWNRLANPRFMKFIICSGLTLVITGFGSAAHMRNEVWKNEGTLWYDAAVKAPELLRPANNLGVFYDSIGKYPDAHSAFTTALRLRVLHRKDELYSPYYNLGHNYHRTGDLENAMEHYRMSLRHNDKYASTYSNMGAVFTQWGRLEDAIEAFKHAANHDPQNHVYYTNLGYTFLRTGDVENAEKAFNRALDLEPDDRNATKGLGYIERLRGNRGNAFRLFGRCVSGPSPDPTVLLYMAEFYIERNMEARAAQFADRFTSSAMEEDLREYVDGIHPGEPDIPHLQEIKKTVCILVDAALKEREAGCIERYQTLRGLLR